MNVKWRFHFCSSLLIFLLYLCFMNLKWRFHFYSSLLIFLLYLWFMNLKWRFHFCSSLLIFLLYLCFMNLKWRFLLIYNFLQYKKEWLKNRDSGETRFYRVTLAKFIRYLKSFYKANLDINKPLHLWVIIYTFLKFRTFEAVPFIILKDSLQILFLSAYYLKQLFCHHAISLFFG